MPPQGGERVVARPRNDRVKGVVFGRSGSNSHALDDILLEPNAPGRGSKEPLLPGVYAQFVTSEGNFTIRLFDQEAPKTVDNFIGLAEGTKQWTDPRTSQKVTRPYYDGVIFHRVIDGFMIQGGDPLGQGVGGPGYTFQDEFHPKLRHNKAGMLSMANRGPNTNGGQFFITLGPTPHLDDRHSVFGEVTEGMEVVRKIGSTRTGPQDRPVKEIVIQTIRIQRPA
jgi:peptidyl-prolyl cis-trans isomerase A (cyclophilin A)